MSLLRTRKQQLASKLSNLLMVIKVVKVDWGSISILPLFALFAVADQDAVLGFSSNDSVVSEIAGSVSVTVSRSVNIDSVVAVDYIAVESSGFGRHATDGSDFVSASETLSFASGETTKTIVLEILDDDLFEPPPDEIFIVTLNNPSAGARLENSNHAVRIADDEVAPTVEFFPSSVDTSVTETDGLALLRVGLSGTSSVEVRVRYEIFPDSASAGEDFSAQPSGNTLVFLPGEESALIQIPIIDDLLPESEETFTVSLTQLLSPTPATISLGANSSANIAISDNDQSPTISRIELEQAPLHISEDVGSIAVPVYRMGDTSISAMVEYATVNGSAISGEDYISSQGTLAFKAGETVNTFTVEIVDSNLSEPLENFVVSLSNPLGAELGNHIRSIVIDDDDRLPPKKTSLRSDGVPTQAVIYGGATLDNGDSYRNDFNVNQIIEIVGTIIPESQDVGKMADIFLVGTLINPAEEVFFQMTASGMEAFDGSVTDLKAFDRVKLSDTTFLDLLQSFGGKVQLGPTEIGNYRLFIGYAIAEVQNGGAVTYNDEPIILQVFP